MNVTLSLDDQLVSRARKKAEALGKSLNQSVRDYLQTVGGWPNFARSAMKEAAPPFAVFEGWEPRTSAARQRILEQSGGARVPVSLP